jgi:hypothetical protein
LRRETRIIAGGSEPALVARFSCVIHPQNPAFSIRRIAGGIKAAKNISAPHIEA